MTEGAYSDHHPSVTPPVNPWKADYWMGISSSGPAAAVAAGLCYGALASDTGGSIRWPCNATGLTGIKPTWSRVSRDGAWPLAPSMDHVGTMARSATDCALLLAAIAGPDAIQAVLEAPAASLRNVRIGIDPAWNENDVDEPVRAVVAAAVDVLRGLGADVIAIAAPNLTDATADRPDLCAAEAAIAHQATYL